MRLQIDGTFFVCFMESIKLYFKTVCNMQIEGKRWPGRLKMTWRTLTERDHRECKLNEVDPCDRDVWRTRDLPCMQLASYLEGSSLM